MAYLSIGSGTAAPPGSVDIDSISQTGCGSQPLTNVTGDSQTMLTDGLACGAVTPQARTNEMSVISALPFTPYSAPLPVSSGTPATRAGAGMLTGRFDVPEARS